MRNSVPLWRFLYAQTTNICVDHQFACFELLFICTGAKET
jgi:hypothetical protein